MDEHLLVAFDGSAPSRRALRYALDADAEQVTALYVVPSQAEGDLYPRLLEAPEFVQAETFDREQLGTLVVETAAEIAAERGQTVETRLAFGSPSSVVPEAGTDAEITHVVVGEPERSAGLSPVARRTVEECPATVTLVR